MICCFTHYCELSFTVCSHNFVLNSLYTITAQMLSLRRWIKPIPRNQAWTGSIFEWLDLSQPSFLWVEKCISSSNYCGLIIFVKSIRSIGLLAVCPLNSLKHTKLVNDINKWENYTELHFFFLILIILRDQCPTYWWTRSDGTVL